MQRPYRLRRSADFERVRAEGKVWRHPVVMLSAAPNMLPHNRYGFVTTKRLGGAVVRNRVRRLLREGVRVAHPHLKTGYDMTFIARNEIVGAPYSTIKDALLSLFQRARLLNDMERTQ